MHEFEAKRIQLVFTTWIQWTNVILARSVDKVFIIFPFCTRLSPYVIQKLYYNFLILTFILK